MVTSKTKTPVSPKLSREPIKRGRGRPQTLDRERTVGVAMETYWRDGLFDISLNEICRSAEVSKPGVYREFGGEDGLMEAVVDRYREEVVVPLLAGLSAERPFADVLDSLVQTITKKSSAPAGCLIAKMRSAPGRLGPATTARVKAIAGEMRRAFKHWYQRALARNEVDPKVTPEIAAQYLDTQLTTVVQQMALGMKPSLIRAQARLALRTLTPSER